MKFITTILVVFCIGYTFTSCAQTGNKNATSFMDIKDCDNSGNTIAEMEAKLTGEWEWKKSVTQSRLGTTVDVNSKKGSKIKFLDDKTGFRTDEQGNKSHFSWSVIKNETQNSFHLKSEPNLYGNKKLVICDDKLELSASSVDGSDVYFNKVSE